MAKTQLEQTTPLSCATFYQETHSRVVQRRCQVFTVPEKAKKTWSGLQVFFVVDRVGMRDAQPFNEHHFYISSQILDAQQLLADTIGHWGIENRLHWGGSAVGGFPDLRQLPFKDVTFSEDFPPRRGGHAPVNWAILHTFFIASLRFARNDI